MTSKFTSSENSSSYILMDLFAGAGGFTEGFARAGFIPVFAVENDKAAAETYRANFGDHCVCDDIEKLKTFPAVDIIIGGPPCQGFSNLGTNIPDDPRNQLWRYFVKAVKKVRPKVFVIENVPPLLNSSEGQAIINQARALGYNTEGRILNSADFGAPQIRKRTIIIGSRVSPAVFPREMYADPDKPSNGRELPPWRTVRDAIGDLPLKPTNKDLHWGRNPTAMSLKRYRCIPPGGNRFDLPRELTPPCWIKKTKGGTDLFGRLWWERPSVTIRIEFYKPEKGRYLHPTEDRPITHREAARLQGFPDDFQFVGSKIEIAKQIGNAVPVDLAYAIALTVRSMLEGTAVPESDVCELPLFGPVDSS